MYYTLLPRKMIKSVYCLHPATSIFSKHRNRHQQLITEQHVSHRLTKRSLKKQTNKKTFKHNLCKYIFITAEQKVENKKQYQIKLFFSIMVVTVYVVVSIPPSQKQSNTERMINPHFNNFDSGHVKTKNYYSLFISVITCIAILVEHLPCCEMQLPLPYFFPC